MRYLREQIRSGRRGRVERPRLSRELRLKLLRVRVDIRMLLFIMLLLLLPVLCLD
jgi:hypothetical protein